MVLRVSALVALLMISSQSVNAAQEEVQAAPAAAETHEFIVAGGDGYGTSECLASTSHCGNIVANAWCESKGHAKAVSYRLAARDETTASTGSSRVEQAFVITCSIK